MNFFEANLHMNAMAAAYDAAVQAHGLNNHATDAAYDRYNRALREVERMEEDDLEDHS
jgi:hypothetical protein